MRKPRNARRPVQFIVVAALALLVLAGCSESSHYSEEVRTNFLKACLDNGGTATSCDCSLKYIEGQKTEAEFVRIEAEMEYEGIVDDVIYDALTECGITSEALGEEDGGQADSSDPGEERADRLMDKAQQIIGYTSDYFGDFGDDEDFVERADALFVEAQAAKLFSIANELALIRTGAPFLDDVYYSAAEGIRDSSFYFSALAEAIADNYAARVRGAYPIVNDGPQKLAKAIALRRGTAATSSATTTPVPDALGVFFASRGLVDNVAERAVAQEVGLLMAKAVSLADPSSVADCVFTPNLVVSVMLDDTPDGPAIIEIDITRDEFTAFAFASAEVYGGEMWAEFYANCG